MATLGERSADRLTDFVGSWKFVIGQAVLLSVWFFLNSVAWFWHWDSYPYVLCNLFMSAEAAFTGPVILMSSNRSAEADRKILVDDYAEDSETNRLVEKIASHLGIDND
jgi:uncharacterized membrane protein